MFGDPELLFLHEPARLQLMLSLASVKELDFVFLLNSTGLSKGNLSVQMSRLNERGLATIEKTTRNDRACTVYRITNKGSKLLKRYRLSMQEVLAGCPS